MQKQLVKPIDYKDCNFITYPGHCIAKYNGIRVAAILNESQDDAILFNGTKEFNFPEVKKQVFSFLKMFPNVIFDGIVGINADIESVKILIKNKDSILRYNIIDSLLTTEQVRSETRFSLYKQLKQYLDAHKENKKLSNLDMHKLYHVSIKEHFKTTVNGLLDEGYNGVLYRTSRQKSPFDCDKYDLVKIEEKIE